MLALISKIIDSTDHEMCYLKDLSVTIVLEKLMLESELILSTYRKYLGANVAGFLAICTELKSSVDRKTRWKELFSPLQKWNCILKYLSVDAVLLSSWNTWWSQPICISQILNNEDQSPEKSQLFHRIKEAKNTLVKCTAHQLMLTNMALCSTGSLFVPWIHFLCSAAWA